MPGGPIIVWENITKQFQKNGRAVEAVRGISATIERGEFVALLGPSGCGKTTLLHMTAGLARATSGTVRYDGEPVQAINTRTGYMTQKDNLLPWRTVEDNIGLPLRIRHVDPARRRALIDQYVRMIGLAGFERHYPAELSGGMRKRVLLARSLIYDPETLLMDEPFGALDAQLRLIMHDQVLRIWAETRKTIVFVTHDIVEAITLADRVIVLTSRPGTVKLVQPVNLPRPRDVFRVRFTPEFSALHDILWKAIEDDYKTGEAG